MDLGSPSYLAAVCAFPTFKKMVASKTQSWAQRKRLVSELKAFGQRFQALEAMMMAGQELSAEEQELYDVTSKEAIVEKVTWLDAELKGMVDAGTLTAGEKVQLVTSLKGRVDQLEEELAQAQAEGKPKKAEKLTGQVKVASTRLLHVQGVEPVRHPLKHEEAIKALRVKIAPLAKLEAMSGLRTMEEMKRIGQRPDLEAEASRLEQESRGWFEEDAEFEARCALIAVAAQHKADRATGGGKKSAKKVNPTDSWETVSSMGTAPRPGSRR